MKNFLIALAAAVVVAALIGIPLLEWDFYKVALGGAVGALVFFGISWGQGHISFSFKRCLLLFALLAAAAAAPARAQTWPNQQPPETGLTCEGCTANNLTMAIWTFDGTDTVTDDSVSLNLPVCNPDTVLWAAKALAPYLRIVADGEEPLMDTTARDGLIRNLRKVLEPCGLAPTASGLAILPNIRSAPHDYPSMAAARQ